MPHRVEIENECWRHEYFIRGCPQLLSKISRSRPCVKDKGSRRAPAAADKPIDASLRAPSDNSSERVRNYDEEKGHYEESVGNVLRQQTSNTNTSYFFPVPFKDEVFEASTFFDFEGASNSKQTHHHHTNNIDQKCLDLEPLPMDSVGILDSASDWNRRTLAEFGHLLCCL